MGRSPAFRSCSRERVPGVFRSPAALRTHVPRSPVQDEGGARGLCPPVRPLGPESLTAAPRAGCSVPALAPRAAPLRGDPRFCVFPELRLPPFKTLIRTQCNLGSISRWQGILLRSYTGFAWEKQVNKAHRVGAETPKAFSNDKGCCYPAFWEVDAVTQRGEPESGKSWVWARGPTAQLLCGREGVRGWRFLGCSEKGRKVRSLWGWSG